VIPILSHIAAAGAGAGIALYVLLLLSRPDRPAGEYPLPTWSDER